LGRAAALFNPSQPHVENLDHTLLIQQQVGGLDVSMDDTFAVSKLQALCSLQNVVDGLIYR